MITVEVRVDPPYPVRIGPGVLAEAGRWLPGGRIAVIADANVAPLHAQPTTAALRAGGRDVQELVVPAGEGAKSVAVWGDLLRSLAEAGFGRDDGVLAVGGGVVTDLAGFVAASYVRGVDVVHAPTSLLGMADAAIGGKTGINLPEGKNLVGAFWQPKAVLMDVTTLRTLPPDVFASGAVEVFKHGVLADPDLAEAVVDGRLSQEADDDALVRWLAASARIKADVVARDAHETAGARATLNLGHTVAHALEAISAHAIDHGGAVAWGLLYAAHLSRLDALRHGRPHVDWSDACRRLLRRVDPPAPTTSRFDELLPFLARDKKNRRGLRRWVLADAPGQARLTGEVAEADERDAWQAFREDVRTLADERAEGASLRREGSEG